jgi:hypothetical protein
MSDENITNPSSGAAQNLAPEPVAAAPSVTTGPAGNSAPVINATPSAPVDEPRHEECRSDHRYTVRWHVDASIDGQGVFQGFVKEISLRGADIYIDHNLQNVKLIKLHIHVPALSKTAKEHIVEVFGKVVYTVYASKESLFRSGIKFVKFNLESDPAYLQSRLVDH